jgi:hypothetical protein
MLFGSLVTALNAAKVAAVGVSGALAGIVVAMPWILAIAAVVGVVAGIVKAVGEYNKAKAEAAAATIDDITAE